MTASQVNGIAVEDSSPVMSPLSRPGERPVYFTSQLELLLADGSIVYGCKFCDFTAERTGQVRHHVAACDMNPLRKKRKATKPPRRAEPEPVEEDDLANLLALLDASGNSNEAAKLRVQVAELQVDLDAVTEDRDRWQRRCETLARVLIGIREATAKVDLS